MRVFYIIFSFLICFSLEAQVLDTFGYQEKFAFGNDIKIPYQVTGSILGLNPYTSNITLGFEKKLGSRYSLALEGGYTVGGINNVNFSEIQLLTEGRRYFNFSKEKYKSNNLNGSYFGLGMVINDNLDSGNYLKLGHQSRFLKYGFFDFSFLAGLIYADSESPIFNFTPKLRMGFAYSPKYSFDFENKKCSILKCYDEQNKWFKINLANIFSFTGGNYLGFNSSILATNIDLEYEQKIAKSMFSISQGLVVSYNFIDIVGQIGLSEYKGENLSFQYLPQFRYYIGKKESIVKGKSGNNLNGFFVGLTGGLIYSEGNILSFTNLPQKIKLLEYGGGIAIGMQSALTSRFFFQINTNFLALKANNFGEETGNDATLKIIPQLKFGFSI